MQRIHWTLDLLNFRDLCSHSSSFDCERHLLYCHQPLNTLCDEQERLPATVRCLSHNSTHVRAMSVARLRDMLYMESLRSSSSRKSSEGSEREEANGTGNWRRYVEQCVVWEVHCRRAGGMSISLLANAASALGCPIPV